MFLYNCVLFTSINFLFFMQIYETVAENEQCTCVPYYKCKEHENLNEKGIFELSIDNMTCEQSLRVCCLLKNIASEEKVLTVQPRNFGDSTCGTLNAHGVSAFKMFGGSNSQFGEFPWMVAILNATESNNLLCGGSLIHPQVVLTAAHCVNRIYSQNKYKIRAGEWDTSTLDEDFDHQERNVMQVVVHPKFRPRSLFYDYALLILESQLDISDASPHIDTICLPPVNYQNPQSNTECIATGWGITQFGTGRYPVILKKIKLPLVESGRCESMLKATALGRRFKLHDSFICAGGKKGVDTCKGDGGGPLVCQAPGLEGRYYLLGITSWGVKGACGRENVPAVYANVSSVRGWINQEMRNNNFDTTFYSLT